MLNIKARASLTDGRVIAVPVKTECAGNVLRAMPVCDGIADIASVDLGYDLACADCGDDGYYAVPRGNGSPDDHICCFTAREDCTVVSQCHQMPIFGYTDGQSGFCAIVTGYTYDYQLTVSVRDGRYSMFPRFPFVGGKPIEPICVEYRLLSGADATYSGMARAYRDYLTKDCGIRPLRERMNDALSYAASSLYIRIRMAWKPVPSPVEEQNDENEPPLHVAITFDGVGDLMERLRAAGVERAEFCLVGWNCSGHDGRWPQCFPVEERLGGEAALRRLIAKAQALGYRITCHTNSTDAYSIADIYSDDIVIRGEDGTLAKHSGTWGGGRARWVCPTAAYEIAQTVLPRVADLGFRGLHYIDVISTVPPAPCHAPAHPLTRRQTADIWRRCAELSHRLFGGFSSEGGYDYTLPYLDYGLYVSFYDTESAVLPPLFTKSVPLWQIALHGIVLSNPYTATVNAPVKPRRHQLEVIERGGRPTVYIFSKFVSGRNWMGEDDITCSDEADTERAVALIAAMYREFAPYARLQTEMIDAHEEIAPGVTRTVYADGTAAIVDFGTGTYRIE